ncbi:MAG: methyltransferase domain-containing protein [Thermomicrobiales bacterium]|nr:methyltransferase domain-containing protein [Thermomicrobiales bacterium]
MRRALLELLVDPITREPLRLAPNAGGPALDCGLLIARDGATYPIREGIPRFVATEDEGQLQTRDAFAYKWQQRDSYDSPGMIAGYISWLAEKYGFGTRDKWIDYFTSRGRILDVGCGSGIPAFSIVDSETWVGDTLWVGADISAAVDVARERIGHYPNTHFVQADALQLPFRDGSFDTVFSEGVLHHTPSTRQAILAVARILALGGEFLFYVYRQKGPVREFTDDAIRASIAPLSDAEAWESMRSLTRLGQALAELQTVVDVPEDVPLLGIKAGQWDVQRLIYWHFAKLFWNSAWTFEENVHVNFDWYRPRYAHRQTADEVRRWCDEAGLAITWFHEQESGYTVRAIRA